LDDLKQHYKGFWRHWMDDDGSKGEGSKEEVGGLTFVVGNIDKIA
jgi:hypothetical protein